MSDIFKQWFLKSSTMAYALIVDNPMIICVPAIGLSITWKHTGISNLLSSFVLKQINIYGIIPEDTLEPTPDILVINLLSTQSSIFNSLTRLLDMMLI